MSIEKVERFCIVATKDKHPSLQQNIEGFPVDVYLRNSERATDVRGYIELVQAIERLCFKMPSENWALAHFGINGPAMVVTAEVDKEPVAAQYVAADCWDGRKGLRFWTTVVHPEFRQIGVASCLTAVSTQATRSWAEFGGTICDTDSTLMCRNIKLEPLIVTANMHHTPGRRKVQLEWKRPEDPFKTLLDPYQQPVLDPQLPIVETLVRFSLTNLPSKFGTRADSFVWEDIALYPDKYYRYFKLIGWYSQEKLTVLQTPEKE